MKHCCSVTRWSSEGQTRSRPFIVMQLLLNDGVWCVILVVCHLALTGLAPKVFGAGPKRRLA